MTENEKLEMVKALTGESQEVVSSYLKLAGAEIINRAYPYDDTVTEVPLRYGSLQCEIATYLIFKRGAEGQIGHSENGITRQYESASIPESMLNKITPHVGTFNKGDVK